ncbi:hypothetical protein Val02_69960 [Virgisporangium aliadipatigenens]|uniref:SIMPL domain-containing protein n=1 Tax=Virgisporangium aliadipatigenens TaxID=741659 RepID=A0A8J4DTD2_9ACTN|nr:SIMPL domain-containing protein [Virgisporangium aliadipatigenens]GIJ50110.1 hypothetical protein Val02_69960 [Virgisporangium aliadipatigenens]
MSPTVAVRGEVTREVPPEIATVSVSVAASDRERTVALTRLSERNAALGVLLDGFGDVIERRETSGLYVYPITKGPAERVTGYRGSVTLTATVADFTVLGDLVLRLADQDQATVSGPHWALRPDSGAHRQARHDAIADALVRAREYAEALGSQVVSLIELADTGLSARDGGGGPIALSAGGGAMRTMSASAPQLDLEPRLQWVHASVEARFAITDPPSLGG